MKTLLTRLAFGLWIVGAPLVLLGCDSGGGSAPAPTPTPAPAPGGDAAKGDAAKTK
jgi:hypothetical protein